MPLVLAAGLRCPESIVRQCNNSKYDGSKTQEAHDLACALCGVHYAESSHGARVDVGCKKMQKTETSELAHAQRAGSPQGGNKAPPTPAPKSRAEKRAAERDNKELQARRNRNGPSKRGHVQSAHPSAPGERSRPGGAGGRRRMRCAESSARSARRPQSKRGAPLRTSSRTHGQTS